MSFQYSSSPLCFALVWSWIKRRCPSWNGIGFGLFELISGRHRLVWLYGVQNLSWILLSFRVMNSFKSSMYCTPSFPSHFRRRFLGLISCLSLLLVSLPDNHYHHNHFPCQFITFVYLLHSLSSQSSILNLLFQGRHWVFITRVLLLSHQRRPSLFQKFS